MNHFFQKAILAKTILTVLLSCQGMAQIIITGDVSAGTGQITICEDYTFNINSSTNNTALCLVFDEWVATDGNSDSTHFASGEIRFSHNGGPIQEATESQLIDNQSVNDMTPNDGNIFWFNNPLLNPGDTFTVKADSFPLFSDSGFNPALNDSTFTGNIFLADGNGNRVSNILNIPEQDGTIEIVSTANLEHIGGSPDTLNLDGTELRMEVTFAAWATWQEHPTAPGFLEVPVESISLVFDGQPAVIDPGEFPMKFIQTTTGSKGFTDTSGFSSLNFMLGSAVGRCSSLFGTNTPTRSAGDPLTADDFGFPVAGGFYFQFVFGQPDDFAFYNTTNTSNVISQAAQSAYSGSEGTGFAGPVGESTMQWSGDCNTINVTFTKGSGQFNDRLVIYLDTGLPGRNSIGSDVNDRFDALRAAISYMEASTGKTLTFPAGFEASHAICIDTGFGGLFSIPDTGSVADLGLGFVAEVGNPSDNLQESFTFSFKRSDLGIPFGDPIKYVAMYSNPFGGDGGNGFASNEGYGEEFPANNIGQNDFTYSGAPLKFPLLLGDVNQDGSINLLDVDPFIERLGSGIYQPEADCDQNGELNLLDVAPFIAILGGG